MNLVTFLKLRLSIDYIEMNDKDQSFPVTSFAMNTFIEQALKCIDVAPRKDSEIAALNVGLAIAYDYLGLIGGRHVTKALKTINKIKRERQSPKKYLNKRKS